jgi:NAD(P)-dependent dehydrogenase (short-subunit alcohol dehydrogenase family)
MPRTSTSLARDYAERGIRVNAIALDPILTHHLERGGEQSSCVTGTTVAREMAA